MRTEPGQGSNGPLAQEVDEGLQHLEHHAPLGRWQGLQHGQETFAFFRALWWCFGQQFGDGGVQQRRQRFERDQRGQGCARLIARHGGDLDLDVFGQLFLGEASAATVVGQVLPQPARQASVVASDAYLRARVRAAMVKQ